MKTKTKNAMSTKARKAAIWTHAEAILKAEREDDSATVVENLNAVLKLLEGMTKRALAVECTDGSTATFKNYYRQRVAAQFGKKAAAGLHFS